MIPTWNGATLLADCLTALRRQTLWPDFDVWVVDNGSTDRTPEVLTEHPWARTVVLPTNLGFAPAVNRGIDASRGDPVVLLNNDTEPESGWLAALVAPFAARAGPGMTTSKVLVHGRDRVIHTTGDQIDLAGMASNRGVWERDRGQYDNDRDVFGPSGAAGAYRRAVFDDVGRFAESFGSYMEDVDLAFRARLAGWSCTFCPEAVVYHHVSATGGGPVASYHVARNRAWVIVRNVPGPLLRRHLGHIAWAQLRVASDAVRAFAGPASRATLRGLAAGWLGAPSQLGARRRIQAKRRIGLDDLEALLGRTA